MSRSITMGSEKQIAKDLYNERTSLETKCIYTTWENHLGLFLFQEGRMVAVRIFPKENRLGAIYIARVKDVSSQLSAIFLKISDSEEVFLKMTNVPEEYESLHQGDLLPVQIIAEAQKGKRAVVTANIAWKKIPDGTAIKEKAIHMSAYSCLKEADETWQMTLMDFLKTEAVQVFITDILDDGSEIESIFQTQKQFQDISFRIYDDSSFPLSKLYSLETHMSEAIASKIWLKSGGYLIINYTEALTIIDVNSGKYQAAKHMDKEQSAYVLNLDAAKECARQLKLKNVSGMVLIDFINMNPENNERLIEEMKGFVEKDPCRVNVIDITPLGIMELTRKKRNKSLREQLQ